MELRQANAVGKGLQAATTLENLPEDWGDALADVAEQGPHILYKANAARRDARVRLKHGYDRGG